jgi:hypothetical protein
LVDSIKAFVQKKDEQRHKDGRFVQIEQENR